MIPKLAVAALALTGCPDGGTTGNGGTAGDGGTAGSAGNGGTAGTAGNGGDLENALSAWCMNLARCFPYSPYYQPTDYCVSYHLTYYGFDESTSAACEAAGISYFMCSTELDCPDFYAANECDDLYNAFYAECT